MTELTFVDRREPAWGHKAMHQFNTPVTAREALEAANLDFALERVPVLAQWQGSLTQIKGKEALVDPRSGKALGIVGPDYQYLQNGELADALDTRITSHYPVSAVGETLNSEGLVFVLDAGPLDILGEEHHQYFLIVETRDGKTTLRWAFTAVRFWCTNTLMAALSAAGLSMAARHDRNFVLSVSESLEWVAMAKSTQAQTQELFTAMGSRKLSAPELDLYLEAVYPSPDDARVKALEDAMSAVPSPYVEAVYTRRSSTHEARVRKITDTRERVRMLYDHFRTPNEALRGTLWAGYNAVAELEDHVVLGGARPDGVRQSALLGDRARSKVRALAAAGDLLNGR